MKEPTDTSKKMDNSVQHLTIAEAIIAAKHNRKVKLPEWGPNHYLYSEQECLFERYEDATTKINKIQKPWIVRKDWVIHNDNGE